MLFKFSDMTKYLSCLLAGLFLLTVGHSVQAQQSKKFGPVSIIAGSIDGSDSRFIDDIRAMVKSKSVMRVAPVLGLGSAQDVLTMIHSKQVEVGFIHNDVLNLSKRQSTVYPDVEKLIRTISRVSLNEVHIIAHQDIDDISELEGKVVNFGPGTERTFSTPYLLFEALDIPVRRVSLSQVEAIRRIETGEIAATVIVAAKPHARVSRLSAKDGVHLLPVKLTKQLASNYVPMRIESADYPELIKEEDSIETVGVANVMITHNWSPSDHRFRKLAAFVEALFSNFDTLHDKRFHPKWREVNFAANVPGWIRFAPAKAWLTEDKTSVVVSLELRDEFERFLKLSGLGKNMNKSEIDGLFKRFQTWER